MNDVLEMWPAEIRRIFEPLRSFRIEAWATIPILAFWLALSALDSGFAASDTVLLCVVGAIACLVGGRLGELGRWPATVLVPRYGQSLFLLCLTSAGSATALGALWSWWLGNPVPAIGPALLIAVGAMVGAMRIPAILVVATVLPFTPILALFLPLAMSFDLSAFWCQLGAINYGSRIDNVPVATCSHAATRSVPPTPTTASRVRQIPIRGSQSERREHRRNAPSASSLVVLGSPMARLSLRDVVVLGSWQRATQLMVYRARPTLAGLDIRHRSGSQGSRSPSQRSPALAITPFVGARDGGGWHSRTSVEGRGQTPVR